MASQNPNRVAGGLKATINNPNISEDTKANASQRLQNFESGNQPESGMLSIQVVFDPGLMAFHPASASKMGRSGGVGQEDDDDVAFEDEIGNDGTSNVAGGGETNRVLGGYKATLKNPNVSDGAKRHAEQVLKDSDAI
ncbi:hypothetical protein BDZ94DRAFT_1305309 [Collybia nuda]|uniref:Conidiation-specific protein 6 n=1 Tax=Collybia nuda TaxID=64659 RepID=A0A9P5YHG3_9AGAR|nr:hypothetical protein BDZ94DRAFT_1305309 [Collybia nuda]